MQLTYDPQAKAVYVYLKDEAIFPVTSTASEGGNVFMDRDINGELIGVEFLNVDTFEVKVNGV